MDNQQERERFEAIYEADAMPAETGWFQKNEDGEYILDSVEGAWHGWQLARASADESEWNAAIGKAAQICGSLAAYRGDVYLIDAEQRILALKRQSPAEPEQEVEQREIAGSELLKTFKLSPLTLAVIGRSHFGNPIPQEWYAAAKELLAEVIEKSALSPSHPEGSDSRDAQRLNWLEERIVHFIELDDFSIIDVQGNSVRAAIDAAIAALAAREGA